MGGAIRGALQQQFDALNELYDKHLAAVKRLQATLLNEILPGLVDEQGWNEQDVDRAVEWLEDTPTVFRVLKRHKFTTSFALDALPHILAWRLQTLTPIYSEPLSPHFRCLPRHARDPFGRPIVVLQLAKLLDSSANLKLLLLHTTELMRVHLVRLNQIPEVLNGTVHPILQYVALLDVGSMSLNNKQVIEIMRWFVREIVPRYPGMLGAVFVLNYTWAHAGAWNIAKRILPSSAQHKIFFPTVSELADCLSRAVLPEDWGGDLPPFAELDDPLQSYVALAAAAPAPATSSPPGQTPAHDRTPRHDPAPHDPSGPPEPVRAVLSSTSLLNPFFGYPAVYDPSAAPSLRHGRRRKRDLLRTLARLWWARWGDPAKALLAAIVLVLVLRKARGHLPRAGWRLPPPLAVPSSSRLRALFSAV